MDDSFLPSLYGEVWYNGNSVRSRGFLSDQVTYLLGSPLIRQLRVVPGRQIYFALFLFKKSQTWSFLGIFSILKIFLGCKSLVAIVSVSCL